VFVARHELFFGHPRGHDQRVRRARLALPGRREARGKGLAAGVIGSLPGDAPCLDRGGPPTLARGSRFGAWSDEAGPQPDSPVRSIGPRSQARRGHSRRTHGRDGRVSSALSGNVVEAGAGMVCVRVPLLKRCI